ncbi:phage head-tail adaptor [Thermaerobacter marianensis DSM 12885]|uniref:Phage head-tail adaptor n=1 Tax=Thermaerobacter marianensis (strain ATCC 700841 / DSM 12885 / JCM 10246 / 7p75a) TaxID=644966 RepID=E6SKI0_THEM7|nr:head-tail adaptor protein [Thermaerobacter marianensis]ADU50167.1 phage head-tail adaptor [Thermaerobacter marianensis DSM 12885]
MLHLLNETVQIQRRTRTSDGQGGWKEGWQDVGTARVRIRPASAREREAGAVTEALLSHVVYALDGADIRRGDRLVRASGETLAVISVRQPSAGHHLEIDAEAVQRG